MIYICERENVYFFISKLKKNYMGVYYLFEFVREEF